MSTQTADSSANAVTPAGSHAPFGVNAMRLSARQWLAVVIIVLGCATGVPRVWKQVERFEVGPDYRIPYALSEDYWLYQWRLERITDPASVPVLGDSVIWGEYVRPTGTLTHFLNQEAGAGERFLNCGVNGLFPLAMEGLFAHYGEALSHRKLIVHCNVLWMTSPKADLSTPKEESFNHARLVPQFFPRIPAYRAETADRLGAMVDRNVGFFGWVGHLDSVYFNKRSIPLWTLEEDGSSPLHYPNAWRNPVAQISLSVPQQPSDDPDRGPESARHKPWLAGGGATTRFDWVSLDQSLQWQAFARTIELLRRRGNDVLVVLGPFNQWMVAAEQRPTFHKLRDGIAQWLSAQGVPCVIPETLPSDLYADASHPLTEGYARLARNIYQDAALRRWLAAPVPGPGDPPRRP